MKLTLVFLVMTAVATSAVGTMPVFYDDFETGYGNGQVFTTATNGWQASGTLAYATNAGGYAGSKAVVLSGRVALTNSLNGDAGLKLWTDFRIMPTLGTAIDNPPTNTASMSFYFNSNGVAVVAASGGWLTCSNDVWGNTVSPVSESGYARVSIYQDYGSSNQALFLNDQLILQDLPFVGTAGALQRLLFQSTETNAWIDNVWVKTNIGPDLLTSDRNGDGLSDGVEIQTYGYACRTQYVGGAGYLHYGTIALAMGASRVRDTVYIPTGTYAEDSQVSNAVTIAGGVFTNSASLSIRAGVAPVFQVAMKWNSVSVETNCAMTCNQAVVCSNMTVRSGATVILQALTCSNLVVEPNASFTCLGAFQCSGACSFGENATGVFLGSLSCPGTFAIGVNSSVTFGQGATLGVLTEGGSVTLGAGQTLAVAAASISGTVQVSGLGTMSVSSVMSVTGSGQLSFTNSRLVVPANNVDMNGTFVIGNTWGSPAPATLPLPFSDGFDVYANYTSMTNLTPFGWGVSTAAAVVQSAVAHAGKAAMLPQATLSNSVSTSGTRIWTDFYVQPVLGVPPVTLTTNTAGFQGYVNSSGYLTVITSDHGWYVCSNRINNTPAAPLSSNSFARISIFQDLSPAPPTFAVFVNGDCVGQGLKSPANTHAFTSLSVNSCDGTSYLDEVNIGAALPAGLISDLDGDGMPDAYEIGTYGATSGWPWGSIYNIR